MISDIYLNSAQRQNKTDSAARAQIRLNRNIEATCAELSYFSMPNTWYNVTTYNNTFRVSGNLITIPPGSYDLNQLLTETQSLLPPDSTILYNDVLNRIEINFTASRVIDFTTSAAYILFGYLPQIYPTATSVISSHPPKIYSSVILVQTNLGSSIVSQDGFFSSFVVPVNVNKGELLQFYNRSQFVIRPRVNNTQIRAIDIVLLDEFEQPLQGCGDFVCVIKVTEKKVLY
jgi:hypothetical protein